MRCKHCGNPMNGRKRRFCDGSCRNAALNAKRQGVAKRECCDCGKPCYGQRCKPCRTIEQTKNWCTCGWCGETFVKPNGGSRSGKFCGRQHAYATASFKARLNRLQHRFERSLAEVIRQQSVTPVVPRKCMNCGATGLRKWHRWCNDCGCKRRKDQRRTERATRKARRRSRQRSNGYETVRPLDVFIRDAYRCGICGSKCKANAVVPHPNAPTIDHIVPLAKGGQHALKNVQCACFMCNSTKQDKAGGQMRLFG